MARRKELKDIASGLYGSFISRNNDVAGYWGIGKLCLLAEQQDVRKVRIDLLTKSMAPASSEFAKLVSGYGSILQRHLSAKRIPGNWMSSAIIEVDYKPEHPSGKHTPIVTRGNLFRLTVTITDDMNKSHTVSGYGYCEPHDPKKEYKSAGEERF